MIPFLILVENHDSILIGMDTDWNAILVGVDILKLTLYELVEIQTV